MSRRPLDVVYWIRGAEHAELAALSAASVRKVYPDAVIHVYTDDPHGTPHVDGTVRHVRERLHEPMVANIDAQLEHITGCEPGQRVLFLDTDTLLQAPFEFGGDMAVTWRDHESVVDGQKVIGVAASMPYNYGVIGVVASPRISEAFFWLKFRVLSMSQAYRNWYGNQLALADLVGGVQEGTKPVRIRWSDADAGTEIRVRMLPCETHNYTPEGEGEDVTDKVVLHLKGKRKHLMAHYAQRAA